MIKTFILGLSLVVPIHSWYDYDCCSDNDCAPVISKVNTGKDWLITTKHGTVAVPYNQAKRPSQDDEEHLCFRIDGDKVFIYCYYVPSGA